MGDNYQAVRSGLGLTPLELVDLARNSVEASFLDPARKRELLAEIGAVPLV